ncbi:MAG: hypothetical protein EBR82_47065 [Caulobacteraceae bacterium]|nr:hypothetical protein [Caulobacteraceae bacterium]
MRKTCETCAYWGHHVAWEAYNTLVSYCHRNAPSQAVMMHQSQLTGQHWPQLHVWPLTSNDDWCGEHAQKDTPDAPP